MVPVLVGVDVTRLHRSCDCVNEKSHECMSMYEFRVFVVALSPRHGAASQRASSLLKIIEICREDLGKLSNI